MSVGHATNANTAVNDIDMNPIVSTYAKQNGTYAGLNVGYATRATRADSDGNGNSIADTYARQDGTYPMLTVGRATSAGEADQAINDGSGLNIATYYAKKSELGPANSKQIVDNITPTAIASIDNRLTTARNIYFGLPFINGKHDYDVNTKIYAPTSAGGAGQLITSDGSSFPWRWVFSAITDDYANIQNTATDIKYFRIPYNANRRFTIVYGRKNSSGSTALFENITFPTAAKFVVTPIVFTTYYGNSDDTGQIENMYGWVRGDKVTKTGFTARSYGGKSFVWLAIGYSET